MPRTNDGVQESDRERPYAPTLLGRGSYVERGCRSLSSDPSKQESMMRLIVCMALATSALLAAGCASKEEPAKQAVASAEAALNQVKPDAQKFAPEQLQAAETDLDAMKEQLARQEYKSVLAAGPKINEELKLLQEAIVSKRTQFAAATHEWEQLEEDVPKLVAAIQDRVNTLSRGRLPAGVQKETFEMAKATFENVKSQWAEATAAAEAGNPTAAADMGRAAHAKAKEISQQLAIAPV
jgi:hypothetical protein